MLLLLLLLRWRWGRVVVVGVSMTAWGRREIFLGRRHLVPLLPLFDISFFLVPAVPYSSFRSARAGSVSRSLGGLFASS